MNNKWNDIKGIIFDYGGTLDTNGTHWFEVLWRQYKEIGVPITKDEFKEAYVYAERTLALKPLIKPNHNFYDVLHVKAGLHLFFLQEKALLKANETEVRIYQEQIAQRCYSSVKKTMEISREVLGKLYRQHPLILVSNFYGNINEILKDFGLLCYFKQVIESSVVGIRKPNPAIFGLGVEVLGCQAQEVVVIGDSFSKDILPARKVGCRTIWLKGEGWDEEADESIPDFVLTDLCQLIPLFGIEK